MTTQTYPLSISATFYSKASYGDPNVDAAIPVSIFYAFKSGVLSLNISHGNGTGAVVAGKILLETNVLPIPDMPSFGFSAPVIVVDNAVPGTIIHATITLTADKTLRLVPTTGAWGLNTYNILSSSQITALTNEI